MDKIAKDMGDIQSRLLHHRPIINAEIRYFVREFEWFSDDSSIVGCITDDKEEGYRDLVESFEGWYERNHLQLNTGKTKELERRGHRESRLLENLSKMVVETNGQMLPTNLEGINQGVMSNIIKRLEAANHMAVRVQQRELEAQQSTQLQMNMEHLKDEWAVFLKKQQRLKEQVDEDHDKVVGRLSTHYSEMKMDLTKFSPF